MKPRVCVLTAPGTNCDRETCAAWDLAGARAERLSMARLRERPALLDEFQALTLPGGFSYGDDCGAGRILGLELRLRLGAAVDALVDRGGLVLGICNGMQALVAGGWFSGRPGSAGGGASGTVPRSPSWLARHSSASRPLHSYDGRLAGVPSTPPPADPSLPLSLAPNASDRFDCRWVNLRAGPADCAFLKPGEVLRLPVAHGEGRVRCADPGSLAPRVALQYIGPLETHPNGSDLDAAGLTDATGRILGLMPHPERAVVAWQCGGMRPGGLGLFQRAVQHLRGTFG